MVCLGDESYYPLEETEAVSLRSLEKNMLPSSDAHKPETSKLEQDVEEILRQVNMLVNVTSYTRNSMRNEWYQVALVFDRVMCGLFCFVFVIYSCALLG